MDKKFVVTPKTERSVTMTIRIDTEYNQKLEDIQEWLSLTHWSQKNLDEKMLNKIQNQLFDLNIIDKKGTFAEMVKAL